MRFKVRNTRTLTTPDGVVWAKGGQVIELDMQQPAAQRLLGGRMNLIAPAEDSDGEPVPLSRHWQEFLKRQGYKAPVTKAAAPKAAAKKRGPGRPKKSEKLANPEE